MDEENQEEETCLVRCYGCKRVFIIEIMKPVYILEPKEDGMIKVKRYLCPDCKEDLKRFKFVKKREEELKKKMEGKKYGTGNKGNIHESGSTKEES